MTDNEIQIVLTASDKASNIIAGLQKVLTGVTKTVSDLTGKYIAYGDQVENLSRFIGINTEESSRLIQVADDAFVSYETLRMAAKNLSEKGFQPNIKTLGQLSDEFLQLQPGLARSQWLIDKFGRSGMEMAKMMELGSEKLNQMNAAVEGGLIIDDAKAANILKIKQSLDGFNDSMDAMKFELADRLLQFFQALPGPMQNVILVMGVAGQSGLLNSFSQLSIIASNLLKGGSLAGIATGIKTFGAAAWAAAPGIWAACGPIVALAAALAALYYVVERFGPSAWTTLNQIALLAGRGIFGDAAFLQAAGIPRASGGPVVKGQSYWVGERGPEPFIPSENGMILPAGASGRGATNITLVYSPVVSLASRQEAETKLMPFIRAALRKA